MTERNAQMRQAINVAHAAMNTTDARPQMMSKPSAGQSMRTRLIVACMLLVYACAPAFAQTGTVMAQPVFTAWDNNGDPVSGGKLCSYAAGGTTPLATYTSSALSTPNSNPVIMDSAGRATIFLTPGLSHKFVLRQPGTTTDCTTGSILWTVDNVGAIPTSSASLDVLGTAGESVTAGQVVYLSDGSGGLTAGSWYKADADLAYASTTAIVGFVPNAISSGVAGTVRLGGTVAGLSSLTVGSAYYVSQTAGGLTATAPAVRVRVLGVASSTSELVMVGSLPIPDSSPEWRHLAQGRLTLESGVAASTTDQSAKTTIYYTPYAGTSIALYASSAWVLRTFAELSLSIATCTASKPYDVWVYDNAGAAALEMLVWTNPTTRATALTTQNGIRAKSGDTTRRYVGSFYCNASGGQADDTAELRTVYNNDNREPRVLARYDATASWTTASGSTWASTRAQAGNRVAVMVGVSDVSLSLTAALLGTASSSTGFGTGIGEDVTNLPLAVGTRGYVITASADVTAASASHSIAHAPAVGYHVYNWLEWSSGAQTAYGSGAISVRSGMIGTIRQ